MAWNLDLDAVTWHGHDPVELATELGSYRLVLRRPVWQREAACRGVGTGAFFVERGQSTAAARAFCEACPVVAECLDYALEHDCAGWWGGVPERQRRRLQRVRGRQAA